MDSGIAPHAISHYLLIQFGSIVLQLNQSLHRIIVVGYHVRVVRDIHRCRELSVDLATQILIVVIVPKAALVLQIACH